MIEKESLQRLFLSRYIVNIFFRVLQIVENCLILLIFFIKIRKHEE